MKIEMTDTSAGRLYWYFLNGQWIQVAKLTGMTRDQKIASLLGRKAEADRGETIDVTHWTRAQIVEWFLTDGVEAALQPLDGTQEDDDAHRAALRALDDGLHPNRVSDDYKLVHKASASGKLVDTTGMTAEEFKDAPLGKRRVVVYDELSPEQKAIVDASNRPGRVVPEGLTKEEFIKWFRGLRSEKPPTGQRPSM
ncbi:hypothetical protein [Microvirga calopogonii]|uniref:hypothetical protein n=1 Tax=Microvirga calopogonii TaxID=2078013 RepID=UPI000E0CE593|nr:hypothetical protein [Microvirga calopogonii]